MSQGVTTRWFAEPCFAHGRLHCILQILFMRVMASFDSRAWINGAPFGWKNILPRPFTGSAWKFSLQRLGQMDAAKSVRQILLMPPLRNQRGPRGVCRCCRRRDKQMLADKEVRILGQAVALGQLRHRKSVAPRDAVERVAALDNVSLLVPVCGEGQDQPQYRAARRQPTRAKSSP